MFLVLGQVFLSFRTSFFKAFRASVILFFRTSVLMFRASFRKNVFSLNTSVFKF